MAMKASSESVRATAPASYERKAEGSPSSLEPALMKTRYLPCQSVGRLPNRQHPHAGAVVLQGACRFLDLSAHQQLSQSAERFGEMAP